VCVTGDGFHPGGATGAGNPWPVASAIQDAGGAARAMQIERGALLGGPQQVHLLDRSAGKRFFMTCLFWVRM
jgi:hypothetical protein